MTVSGRRSVTAAGIGHPMADTADSSAVISSKIVRSDLFITGFITYSGVLAALSGGRLFLAVSFYFILGEGLLSLRHARLRLFLL